MKRHKTLRRRRREEPGAGSGTQPRLRQHLCAIALDHSPGSSSFKLIMSNSGGVMLDYPPNQEQGQRAVPGPDRGYGGFHRNPQHVESALSLFEKLDG
ncbi:MAG: hypothetical protein H0T87_05900 [Gammaproteobacteria bacterium]|nr:hypothetical protein [Gammaproteobacteria bacterium]